jgi:putative transposase
MAEQNMALIEYLRKLGLDGNLDFLRESVRLMSQLLMEAEVEERVGAGRHERTPERTTRRNGYRDRIWETRVGDVPLRIPKLRTGSYFPSLLQPRRKAEQALLNVIQEAYIHGVSTRKVDDLVQRLGLAGIDKSRVSRICKELDHQVAEFRGRTLEGEYPYLWLDALYVKARQNHRIVSRALVIATGVRESGEREVLGFDVGDSEDKAFWQAFLRDLKRRGLGGVHLIISDAHEGLKGAISEVFSGASWQRCRVHFMRNLLAYVPQADKSMVAAAVRTIFAQPSRKAASEQLTVVAEALEKRWPKAAQLLIAAEDDILAYMAFPKEHWTRIYSTNPLERLNKEIRRRTDVVGVFPNDEAVVRLTGAVLMEVNDEWQIERRYFSQESMRKLTAPESLLDSQPHPLRLPPVR